MGSYPSEGIRLNTGEITGPTVDREDLIATNT